MQICVYLGEFCREQIRSISNYDLALKFSSPHPLMLINISIA